jgi:hypothetical protein
MTCIVLSDAIIEEDEEEEDLSRSGDHDDQLKLAIELSKKEAGHLEVHPDLTKR